MTRAIIGYVQPTGKVIITQVMDGGDLFDAGRILLVQHPESIKAFVETNIAVKKINHSILFSVEEKRYKKLPLFWNTVGDLVSFCYKLQNKQDLILYVFNPVNCQWFYFDETNETGWKLPRLIERV